MSEENTPIEGHCPSSFQPVADAFRQNFAEHDDLGASFCLVRHGETVIDLWGGYLDVERTRPWQRDTLVNVYSTTKTMTALSALLLADRGELDFDRPVRDYWPEFGKPQITTAHFMSHTAGLSGLDEPTVPQDLYDWEKITGLLAAQDPWWEPGTVSGYHAITQGYLTGEVVRRITGQTLGTFFRKEIAEPLGTDFHIGLPEEHDERVGDLVPPQATPQEQSDPHSIAARTFANPFSPAENSSTTAWRRAEIPAAGGIGNARSVAQTQAVLAMDGELQAKRLLSPEGCRRALEEQTSGVDLVLGVALSHGLGYGLGNAVMPLPSPNACFWGGWGGSTILVDFDQGLALSYVMNRMEGDLLGDVRGGLLTAAVYQSLAQGA